jgi:hypothetical protein
MSDVYITLEWREQGPMDESGRRLEWTGRQVSARDYPQKLSCHNPNCQHGGFEIGEKIAEVLKSGHDFEQNSLVCRNAVHPDRNKRCLHTISYSIACVFPHGRN